MKFIADEYKNSRGGYSRLYKIICRKCNDPICLYQKDGPGNLRSMYLDRMFDQTTNHKKKELTCQNNHILGIKITHNEHNESREAYRLFVDAIIKTPVNIKSLK